MNLDDVARVTAKLDAASFRAKYPHPALVFLTAFARPEGNLLDTLSAMTMSAKVGSNSMDPQRPTVSAEAARQVQQVGKASLVLFLKPRFDPDEGVTLGRAPGNDYALPNPSVSKSHANFTRSPTGWLITDVGSTNGTFIDGQRLPPLGRAKLADGALVGFGPDTMAKFFTPDGFYGFLKLYRSGLLA
jgi:hypothetical protein